MKKYEDFSPSVTDAVPFVALIYSRGENFFSLRADGNAFLWPIPSGGQCCGSENQTNDEMMNQPARHRFSPLNHHHTG